MKIRLARTCFAFCLSITFSLIFAGCFQPVDLGETIVETATAHLEITNVSTDEFYVLEGLELRNAEGAVVWDDLKLSQGQSRELSTELAGTFTIRYRVKDTWFSANEVKACDGGEVEIALNKSHKFLFTGEKLDITRQDSDGDGYPDVWETENGFDPENPADGGPVYVSASGRDEPEHGNGTPSRPYKTLAKALAKAGRGLSPEIRSVVVVGPTPLTLYNGGNGPNNPEYPGRADSVFYLGKTRNRVTIRGEGNAVLNAGGSGGKRVLYLGPGADVALRDITITGGRGSGGGVYASEATLSLESGAVVADNNQPDIPLGAPMTPENIAYLTYHLTGIDGGGVYMERGALTTEPGSSVRGNWAQGTGGIVLVASRFAMKGGAITDNHAVFGVGGLYAAGSTIEMFTGAEISSNEAGTTAGGDSGGGAAIGLFSDFTMHGGKIIDNKITYGFGAGIYVTGESKLIMKNGEISGNECTANGNVNTGRGGGVMVVNGSSFTMEGGKIAGNKAGRVGGGLFLSERNTKFTILGGTIYGKNPSDAANKNIANTESDTYAGHAIHDIRPDRPGISLYNNDVTPTSFPQTP